MSILSPLTERLRKERKILFAFVILIKAILFFGGLYLVYLFLNVLNIGFEPLLFLLQFFQTLKMYLILILLYLITFVVYLLSPNADFTKLFFSTLLAYFITIFNTQPSTDLLTNPALLLEFILQHYLEMLEATVLILIILATLTIIGFSRTLRYEKLLNACLLVLFAYILGVMFTPTLSLEEFPYTSIQSVFSLEGITTLLSLREIIFILYFFIYVELSAHLAYAAQQLNAIAEKHKRISRQLTRIQKESSKGAKIEISLPQNFTEILSPLATTILRDAYEGYAFLGEGTSLYVTSKVIGYIEEMSKKRPEIIPQITGRKLVSSTLRFLGYVLLPSLILRIFFGIFVIISSFLVAAQIIARLASGYIFESTLIQSFVYATLAVMSLAYIISTLPSVISKRK
ncbi:MAG: hypothetical protein ACTSX9_02210 [Candidatus Njordarchaeales archaeon]